MKNILKSAFNGVSAFAGATGTVYGGGFAIFSVYDYLSTLGNPAAVTTLGHVATTTSITAASILLFAAGYTQFFGSGKTIGAVKKILGPAPQDPQP